jgi:hypothetical protein
MRSAKRLAITLGSAMAVVATAGTLAATASAATTSKPVVTTRPVNISHKCSTGIWSGYCGTEQNVGDGLGFSFNGSSDWLAIQYQGGTDVFFMYAPNGMPSNSCITESGARVHLGTCTGAKTQLFTPTQETDGFTWENVRYGLYLQANGNGLPLTGATGDGGADQEWNFTTS